MSEVPVLPFDTTLGYPQKQRVAINSVAYTLFYRWNPEDGGFVVLKIQRDQDGATVFSHRLAELTPVVAMDPLTYATLFTLYPYLVTDAKCEVWLIYE